MGAAICIELLRSPEGADNVPRFTSCVAVDPGRPGLGLSPDGRVTWRDESSLVFLLAAEDGRVLAGFRGTPPFAALLERRGREIAIPSDGALQVLQGDEIRVIFELAGAVTVTRFRIHLHGPATGEHEPMPLDSLPSTTQEPGLAVGVRERVPAVVPKTGSVPHGPLVSYGASAVGEVPPGQTRASRDGRRRILAFVAAALAGSAGFVAALLWLLR